jgi:diguanylate cyclase (GGDEF)-like protein
VNVNTTTGSEDKRARILVVDDAPSNLRLLTNMLADEGYIVHPALSGKAALRFVQTLLPDLILLDIIMPEMDGYQLCERLKADERTCEIPVIFISSADQGIDKMRAFSCGGVDYIVRPLQTEEVVARIKTHLSLRNLQKRLEDLVRERTVELIEANARLREENLERKQAEERVRYLAHYDALTSLPNRVLLQDRVRQAIAYAHRKLTRAALLFIDLDYFKHINDSLGHHIGDRLLEMVAARLRLCLREGDSVARLGGDEFVLCLPFLRDESDAALVAQKVLDGLNAPFLIDGHELHVTASIGISLYPGNGNDVEALMRTADTAMYHAKERGRNNYQFFTPALNRAAQQRLAMENRLRRALARGEFELYYQPQVDMTTGTIFAAEALLRWQRSEKPPISCGSYISVAEETGLILGIGEWVLRQAWQQLKRWQDTGHPDLRIAVNLSPRQFSQPQFVNVLAQILEDSGVDAGSIDLEITESLLLHGSEDNVSALKQLSDMGMQLSVDDFGTGYSSLAYLQRFPVHALKIDQSFVRDIGQDPNATALVGAIIAMAQSLHLDVLAEGVETSQQADFLISNGCRMAQGFLYSGPVPADVFTDMLHASGRARRIASGKQGIPGI